jgi:hypothetical protein
MKLYLSVDLPDHLALSFLRAIKEWDEQNDPDKNNLVTIETYTANEWPAREKLAFMKTLKPDFFMIRGRMDDGEN